LSAKLRNLSEIIAILEQVFLHTEQAFLHKTALFSPVFLLLHAKTTKTHREFSAPFLAGIGKKWYLCT